MATVTSTAPTEAEIREAIGAARAESGSTIDMGSWIAELIEPLYQRQEPEGDVHRLALWGDLRPSEADDLADLREVVFGFADAIEAEAISRISQFILDAALEFARRYPDAPRNRQLIEA